MNEVHSFVYICIGKLTGDSANSTNCFLSLFTFIKVRELEMKQASIFRSTSVHAYLPHSVIILTLTNKFSSGTVAFITPVYRMVILSCHSIKTVLFFRDK